VREPSLSAGRAPVDGCNHLTQSALAQAEYSRKAQTMQAVSPPTGGEPFLPTAQAGGLLARNDEMLQALICLQADVMPLLPSAQLPQAEQHWLYWIYGWHGEQVIQE
jgi:hypothetical protein